MFFFLRPSPEPSGSCLQSWFSLQLIFITPLQSFENGQALILVVFCFLFATYPQPFFPLFSVYEALFALSFSFLSERFSSVHAKAALAYSRNDNTGVTGRILPPNTDFEHVRVWPT